MMFRAQSYTFMPNMQPDYASNPTFPAPRLVSLLLPVGILLCAMLAGTQPLYAQSGSAAGRVQLPDLGSSASTLIPEHEAKAYSRYLLSQLRQYDYVLDDPLVEAYFQDLAFRIVAVSDEPDRQYLFTVLNEPSINAFAVPGGLVALHTGMILEADNASEIAGVLAHEIAHISQQHAARRFEAAQKMSVPLMIAAIGLILVGGTGAIAPAIMGTQGVAMQQQINYTRANEHEADRIGISWLSAAGFDPNAMATMFNKLGRASRNFAIEVPEYLRTHPVSSTRVAEAKNRAASMPQRVVQPSLDFFLIQARVQVLTSKRPEQALQAFRDKLRKDDSPLPEAWLYGEALALQQMGDYDQARENIQTLLGMNPTRLEYQIARAQLELDAGNTAQSIDQFEILYRKFAGNRTLGRYYAQALLKTQKPELAARAGEILRNDLLVHRDDPKLYELQAQAAHLAGDDIRASSASAESSYWRGQIHDAISQLRRLNNRDDLNYYQRARISNRLAEMQLELEQLVSLGYISATADTG
jgi:predicted Zn-dependent protease